LDLALNKLENIQSNLTLTSAPEGNGGTNIDNNTLMEARTTPSPPIPMPPQQQPPQLQQQNQGASVSVSIVPCSSSLTTDAFSPNPVQVSIGATVTWINHDAQPHTATSGENETPNGKFDSLQTLTHCWFPGRHSATHLKKQASIRISVYYIQTWLERSA
jgi:plastocyanin